MKDRRFILAGVVLAVVGFGFPLLGRGASGRLPVAQQEPAPAPPLASDLPLKPDMPCSAVIENPMPYQGKLTPAEEDRAREVYRRAIVITAHDHCFHPKDFEDQRAGGVTVRTLKLTTDGIYWQGAQRFPIVSPVAGWERRGRMAIDIVKEEIAASRGRIVPVRSLADIVRVKREGKQGVILSFEGGRPLEGKLENLKKFYDEGLRDMQLFWAVPSPLKNRDNTIGDFGLNVIREMNSLGIVIDISHLNQAAFEQVLATTKHPVVISHAAVAAVSMGGNSGQRANGTDQLSDAGLRALAANGGALCLHFYAGYIRAHHGSRPTVEDLVDHMDYVKKLVGIDYVALGTDYFPEKTTSWIGGAETTRGMPNVVREMVRRGYTDDEILKVLGENLMRIYKRVWRQ